MSTYVVQNNGTVLDVHFFPLKGDMTGESWRAVVRIGSDMTLYLSADEVRTLAADLAGVAARMDGEAPLPADTYRPSYVGTDGGNVWAAIEVASGAEMFRGTHAECVAWIARGRAPARVNDVEAEEDHG